MCVMYAKLLMIILSERIYTVTDAYKICEILDKISEIFGRGHILCQRKNRENFSNLVELFIYKSK